jgi:prepilin peptidase CpaA
MVESHLLPSGNLALDWLRTHLNLVAPFLLALCMALSDVRTRRIPNYLTFGGALTGLGFQLGFSGWPGLLDGFLGLLLGFSFLFLFYLRGGMGAGDVKALAALGAWLGSRLTFYLFIYMAISGVGLLIIYLWWQGLLWLKIRHFLKSFKGRLLNWILLRPYKASSKPSDNRPTPGSDQKTSAANFPYATAMAAGMAILLYQLS